jgi:hypothetical protein
MYRFTFIQHYFEAGVTFFSTLHSVKIKTRAMQAATKEPAPRGMVRVDVKTVVTSSFCAAVGVG